MLVRTRWPLLTERRQAQRSNRLSDMERIDVNPKRPWREYLRAAQVLLKRDGSVLLIGEGSSSHRPLRRIHMEFSASPKHRGRVAAHFLRDGKDSWQLVIATPECWPTKYDEALGLVEAS